jgi:hypothetical protein
MAYAVAILLISALTTVGLLALWAATSTAHWFWRTMGFLAAISPVLLIPAYEPFVAFSIQGAVVAAGVQFAKWRTARKEGEAFFKSQFSVRTVLLTMAPIGLLTAVAVRLPELNHYAWQSVVMIGLGAGVTTLTAWWIAYGHYDNWKIRGLLALLIVSAVSIPVFSADYFMIAMNGDVGWPPDLSTMGLISVYGPYAEGAPALIWTPILLTALVLLATFLALFGKPSFKPRRTRIAFGVALLLLLGVPSAICFLILMNPLPIPVTTLPNPNGHDDFLKAVQMLPANLLINGGNFEVETATEQELKQASDEISMVLDRVRDGSEKQVMQGLNYNEDDLGITDIQGFRTISRGFDAQGRWLLKQDKVSEAAEVFIDSARFGSLLSRGGLMIDDLVGVACSGIAYKGLHKAVDKISVDQIPELIAALQELETERDPWKDVLYRDQVWSQQTYGWYGQLMVVMSQYVENGWDMTEGYEQARQQELAVIRLLQLELARRLWQAEHEGWPKSVDVLAPDYIAEIPVDPYSFNGEPMNSVVENDRLIIYSVSRNRIDEGGMKDEDGGYISVQFKGDLRLDILYAPEPSTPIGQSSTADEDDEAEIESPD